MRDRIFDVIYLVLLKFIYFILYLFSFFNSKLAIWFWYQKKWKKQFVDITFDHCVWIHVSSVGEFRMAVPLILSIKKSNANEKIIVSFFSVSIFNFIDEIKSHCDFCFLLPKDFIPNIHFIIEKINPKILILVKNERWLNLLKCNYKKGVKVFLVEARTPKKQNLFENLYYNFVSQYLDSIFYENKNSLRIQSIYSYKKIIKNIENIRKFVENNFVIILGSCYEIEVGIVSNYYKKYPNKTKIILAPHFFDSQTIEVYQEFFTEKIGKYSLNELDGNILFLDSYGILRDIYQYADVALVGGGFDRKLHNIFEPLIHAVPVFIGNHFHYDYWIEQAIEDKLVDVVNDNNNFISMVQCLRNHDLNKVERKNKCDKFFLVHKNASDEISLDINKKIKD